MTIPSGASAPATATGGAADLLLVRRALTGDPAAVEAVLSRLSCVVKFVFQLNRKLGYGLGTEALEDVVQQVYMSIWPRLRDYNGAAALDSWAFGFCRNCLRAELRRRRNSLRVVGGNGGDEDDRMAELPDDTVDGPGRAAERGEGADVLREELDRLDARERLIIELRHLENWSFERIAQELELPASTVKDRCYRGMNKLKEQLRRRDVVADG